MRSPVLSRRFPADLSRTALFCATGLASLAAPSIARADLYVADTDLVDRFNSSTGAVIQTSGQDTFTTFFSSTGLTVGPDGSIYVATSNPGLNPGLPVVNRYNASTGAQIGAAFIPFVNGSAQLSNAQGLVFGPNGNFYVADEGDNGPVKSFTAGGGFLDTYATTGGNAQAVAFNPADSANIYVATGSTIEQINLTTHVDHILVQGSSSAFSNGSDLAFGPDGKLYVLDTSSADPRIFRYNADGTGQTVFADFNSAEFASETFQPADFAFGPNGDLFVTGMNITALSSQQGEIMKINSTGTSFSDFVTNLNAPGFLAFTTVPEPGSLAILAAGAMIVSRRRRIGR